jgi:hypothetical protein
MTAAPARRALLARRPGLATALAAFVLALALPATLAAAPDAGMDEAIDAYRSQRYGEAHEAFAFLAAGELDAGRRAVLHADAGTAAARAERFGEAIWHFHEALRAAPRDAVARRNLAQLELRLGAGRESSEDLTETIMRLPLVLTEREAHLGGTSLLTLAILLVVLRRAGFGGRFLTTAALLLFALGALWWVLDGAARTVDLRRSVVLSHTQVHGEPSDQGKVLFRLDPGTVVLHQEDRGAWTLVETTAGGRGWLPSPSVRRAGG